MPGERTFGSQPAAAVLCCGDIRPPFQAGRAPELGSARATVIAMIESWEGAARRLAFASLLSLGVGAILVAGWSLAHGGIGWDSRFDTGAALAARSVDSSRPLAEAYNAVPSTSEFYGLFLYQFADVLHLLTTGATEPLRPDRARHLPVPGCCDSDPFGDVSHRTRGCAHNRISVDARRRVRVVVDARNAPMARDVSHRLQRHAYRCRHHARHRRSRAQLRDRATCDGDRRRRPPCGVWCARSCSQRVRDLWCCFSLLRV